MTTAEITTNLLPCFVAALAAQRITEFVDLAVRQGKTSDTWPGKKTVYLFAIFIVTLIAVWMSDGALSVFKAVSRGTEINPILDHVVSALVISGGTETINEILKLVGYKKDEAKANARALPSATVGANLAKS